MSRRHDRFFTLAKVSLAVVATLLLLELSLAALFSARSGELFYSRPRPPPLAESSRQAELLKQKLHPYYGFSFVPGLTLRDIYPPERLARRYSGDSEPPWIDVPVNAFGFLSPDSYPIVRAAADELVVAITGGSVAQWFFLQGTEVLERALRESDAFRDREIIFLNLASVGYKQPQQLLILMLMLSMGQDLDMVINLDGFNEVALSNLNQQRGVDVSMPSSVHLKPLASLGSVTTRRDVLAQVVALEEARAELEAIEGSLEQSRSAAAYFVGKVKQRYLAAVARELTEEIGEAPTEPDSILNLMPPANDSRETRYDEIAALWLECSHLMDTMLKSLGVLYFHFLQPNQYFSHGELSEAEEAITLREDSPYREGVEEGYPMLLEALERLAAKGTNVFSAVAAFDTVAGSVYSDTCCHYDQRGNEILARFIAEKIVTSGALRAISSTRSSPRGT